jgi:hypothetical protein
MPVSASGNTTTWRLLRATGLNASQFAGLRRRVKWLTMMDARLERDGLAEYHSSCAREGAGRHPDKAIVDLAGPFLSQAGSARAQPHPVPHAIPACP